MDWNSCQYFLLLCFCFLRLKFRFWNLLFPNNFDFDCRTIDPKPLQQALQNLEFDSCRVTWSYPLEQGVGSFEFGSFYFQLTFALFCSQVCLRCSSPTDDLEQRISNLGPNSFYLVRRSEIPWRCFQSIDFYFKPRCWHPYLESLLWFDFCLILFSYFVLAAFHENHQLQYSTFPPLLSDQRYCSSQLVSC